MRTLLPLVALCLLAPACAQREFVTADRSKQANFVVISLGGPDSYVIDPRTHTCLLRMQDTTNGNFAITPVSCALLKQNLPEAAKHVTWVDATP